MIFSILPYVILISALLTLLSGNVVIITKIVSELASKSVEINSLHNYWSTIFNSLNSKAIYSSITLLSFATAGYCILLPKIYYDRYFFNSNNQNDENSNNDYFKDLNSNQIKRMVLYLYNELSNKPTKHNYQLTHKMLYKDINALSPLNIKLQIIADRMKEHLLLTKTIKVVVLDNIGAGKYESMGDLKCIYVNGDLNNQNLEQKVAVLAHEMAHYYLDYNNLRFADTNDNELLTEICTSYIGFGLLLLKGYKYNVNNANNAYTKVGYIDDKVILESLVLTAEIRKQNPNWLIKNVTFETKLILRYRLRALIKKYNKSRKAKA